MLSILNSKFVFTYISFYLILSEDFEIKNLDFLLSLYDQFDLFNITFLKIDNRYKTSYISKCLRNKTYLIFSLGELIPYLNIIIYLDTDIIVYKDLAEFYHLNFKGKIILLQPTFLNKNSKTGVFKITNSVLLLNLIKMRKLQIEKKVLYILNNQFQNEYHDQFLYNQYFYELIGIFPAKYYIRPLNNSEEINIFNKTSCNDFDNDYLYFSLKYPFIVHSAFNSKAYFGDVSISEDWWYLAGISKYYKQKTENISLIFNYTYK
jgi:lipopolysaccharide biosynthesis glycosyltransferase